MRYTRNDMHFGICINLLATYEHNRVLCENVNEMLRTWLECASWGWIKFGKIAHAEVWRSQLFKKHQPTVSTLLQKPDNCDDGKSAAIGWATFDKTTSRTDEENSFSVRKWVWHFCEREEERKSSKNTFNYDAMQSRQNTFIDAHFIPAFFLNVFFSLRRLFTGICEPFSDHFRCFVSLPRLFGMSDDWKKLNGET